MLQHNDRLPYDFGRLLTPAGFKYAEAPENLNRYWDLHRKTFQPGPFEGQWHHNKKSLETEFKLTVSSSSVTVICAELSFPLARA